MWVLHIGFRGMHVRSAVLYQTLGFRCLVDRQAVGRRKGKDPFRAFVQSLKAKYNVPVIAKSSRLFAPGPNEEDSLRLEETDQRQPGPCPYRSAGGC